MVKMTVGIDNVHDRELVGGKGGEDPIGIVPGINDHSLTRLFTSQNKTVGLNGAKGHLSYNQFYSPIISRFRPEG
jgi:hypothetical protein